MPPETTNDSVKDFVARAGIKLSERAFPSPKDVLEAKRILEQRGESITDAERNIIHTAILSVDII